MLSGEIIVRRAWRSQLKQIVIYLILCVAAVTLSRYFPGSVVSGELFTLGASTLYLALPLFSLFPMVSLMLLIVPIYDATFTIDARGIELRRGILGWNQHIMRVRYEDIRGVELEQNLIERALNIGAVGIGTAAQSEIEIYLDGIPAPQEIKEMIQAEKDQRIRTRNVAQVSAA